MKSYFGSFRARVFALVMAGLASTACANPAFDQWVDAFTAEWVRGGGAGGGAGRGKAGKKSAGTAKSDAAAKSAEAAKGEDPDDAESALMESYRARRDRQLAQARRGLEELKRWPDDQLDRERRVSAAVLRWRLEQIVTGERFEEHTFVFNQFHGLHVSLVNSLAERFKIQLPREADDYLERLKRVGVRIDEGLARTRSAAAKQLIPPGYIIERARQQVQAFLEPAPAANVLVTSFRHRLAAVKELDDARRADLLARAEKIVAEEVRPSFQRLDTLLGELLPRAAAERGLAEQPDGVAAYNHALATFTSTRLTADEIHAIGLREVARLEGQMDTILKQMGYTEGSFTVRLAKASAGTPLPADPDPRGVILARYTEIIRDAQKRSEQLFNLKPAAPVEVRREPALTERTAAAHYTAPAPDGSRPGIFWAPLPGEVFALTPRMRSLAYHEAVPGHHFQIALQQEQKHLPRFRARRSFGGISAHSEGWALYVERLAVEQGWYEGDPASLLGALGSELFRARRLVVDTGLHTKRWTRQQAIDYGIPANEVERYIANPGQACSYMIGMLKIVELREQAKAALGAKFSLPAFHDVILRNGTLPLDVLGQVIGDWVAEVGRS
jgi:uncharacterized protein (DUF885 family)